MKKPCMMILIMLFLSGAGAWAQERTITGTVTSSEDGMVLPGVTVTVKGTIRATQTDAEGTYSIEAQEGEVLEFAFLGMQTAERTVGDAAVLDVVLQPDAEALEEVVVTAMGLEQEQRRLGYQVQEIEADELARTNQPNPVNALKGRAAGVQITSAGGAPGSGSRVQIRGINSLNPAANNQPLFIIDGIPVSNETNQFGGSGGDNFQNTNRFADINPDDIESMSILKGPAASVLYGLRAANGAVVITTKSGQAGEPRFNYRMSYSFDDVATTPPIQTRFGNGSGGAFVNHVDTWGPVIEPGLPVYNPYDAYFRTGNQMQHSLSYSGGTEKATYFTSVSYLDQGGVVPNSDYGRISVRLSGTLKASDKLSFEGSANYINSGGTNPRTGTGSGAIFYLMRHTNTVDPTDYLNPDGSQMRYTPGIDNPFYFSEQAYLTDNVNRVLGNVGAEYVVNDWLTFNYKAGVDHYSDFREAYNAEDLLISAGSQGSMSEIRLSYNEINSNFFAKATRQLSDKWSGTLLLGHSFTNIKSTSLSSNGQQAVVPGFRNIGNYSVYTSSGASSERNIIGVFGDLNINYDNTLYFNLTARNDWSSTLPENNRSFFYPSASLSYIFTESLGLSNSPLFHFGKLRLSYAEVGKDADPYQVGAYYQTLDQAFDGITGVRRSTVHGSESLRPERTRGLEFGGEFRFFDGNLSLDANYAITNSIDQIVPVPVSFASGYDVYVTNAGKIRNRSIELLLTANIINTDNFSWDVQANWARTRGRVMSMPDGVDEVTFNPETPWVKQIIKTGGRPGDWYGWPYRRAEDPGGAHDGELLIGEDGYPMVPEPLSVEHYAGNAFPQWTGGLGSSFSYKGLSFSFLFNFRKGGEVFDIVRWQRYATGIGAETELRNAQVVFKGVRNAGTEDAPEYVPNDIPVTVDEAFYFNAFQYRLAAENNGLQDGSWIRLQNVSLSYRLPRRWLDDTFIQSVAVSVTGNNLWVTTPFVGFDPEASNYGAASNAIGYVGTGIPTTRSVYVGLNVDF